MPDLTFTAEQGAEIVKSNAAEDAFWREREDAGPDDDDPLLWSVDQSFTRYVENPTPRKYHIDGGDTTAKCSKRILLNSLQVSIPAGFTGSGTRPDVPEGRLSVIEREHPEDVCRRCVPRPR